MRVCPSQSCPASVRTDPSRRLRARSQRMAMLADTVEVVIGVDTHKHTHTAAVVVAATGGVVRQATVPATSSGDQQLLRFATCQPGRRVWANEGTGGYGAGPRPVGPAPRGRPPGRRAVGAAGRSPLSRPAAGDAQRQLHALVIAAPPALPERLRAVGSPRQLVAACARMPVHSNWDIETRSTAATLWTLARRSRELTAEATDH